MAASCARTAASSAWRAAFNIQRVASLLYEYAFWVLGSGFWQLFAVWGDGLCKMELCVEHCILTGSC